MWIEDIGRSREIPATLWVSKYNVEMIITGITRIFNIDRKLIFSKYRGNLYQSLATYLIKYFTSLSLAEISQLFKMDYSAVSQVAKRLDQKSRANPKIEKIKQKMIAALNEY